MNIRELNIWGQSDEQKKKGGRIRATDTVKVDLSEKEIEREKKELVRIGKELCYLKRGDVEYMLAGTTTLHEAEQRLRTRRLEFV